MTTSIQSIDANTSSVQVNGAEAVRLTPSGIQVSNINGGPISGFRNRIINGDMRIDQRNNGAALNAIAAGTLANPVDRWTVYASTQGGRLNVGQNLGAGSPPPGYSSYLGVTVGTAMTAFAAGEQNIIYQGIEGLNMSDFGWGTTSAKTIVLSFLVYSSLTGLHTGTLRANTRSYPFQFNVSTPNMWTTITVTIPGDTTGTWATDNTVGVDVIYDLGSGTSVRGSAGWQTGAINGVTGSVMVAQTLGAVFGVTGVQLEIGTIATAFERRNYGHELMLCQRYFQAQTVIGNGPLCVGQAYSSSVAYGHVSFTQPMRAAPTITQIATAYRLGGEAVGSMAVEMSYPTGFLFHVASTTTAFVAGNAVMLLQGSSPTPTQPIWTASAEF